MKQLIVLIAMIALGIFIGEMVFSDDSTSMKSIIGKVWEQSVLRQNHTP